MPTDINFPCQTCGHNLHFHYDSKTELTSNICTRCRWLVGEGLAERGSTYHEFIPDNLKYLEDRYDATR